MNIPLFAQSPLLKWSVSLATNAAPAANALATDESGNSFVAGDFFDTLKIESSHTSTELISNGHRDVFLMKVNKYGEVVWAKSFGGEDIDAVADMALDQYGNSYLIGRFSMTVDFDPGSGTDSYQSKGSTDAYISKFDSRGKHLWTRIIGGTSSDAGYSIDVDTAGYVISSGGIFRTVDLNTDTDQQMYTARSIDFFVHKMDFDGKFVWAKGIGGDGIDKAYTIKSDPLGYIYVGGTYSTTVDFDPGSANKSLTSNGGGDAFLMKLTPQGNYIWAGSWGAQNDDYVNEIGLDKNGDVSSVGSFENRVDFDPSSNTFSIDAVAGSDAFVSKLDASGRFQWAKSLGGSKDQYGYGLAVDQDGNSYATGVFESELKVDKTMSNSGGYDIYLVKLNNQGAFQWSNTYGASGNDWGYRVTTNSLGDIWLSAIASGNIMLDSSANKSVSNGGFLARFSHCNNDTSNLTIKSCEPYSYNGKLTLDSTGIYYDTIEQTNLCDSIYVINFELRKLDAAIRSEISHLKSLAKGVEYQWLKCEMGRFTPILGENDSVFNPEHGGFYSVAISDSLCSDTSQCLEVIRIPGSAAPNRIGDISLYPNPSNGVIQINLKDSKTKVLNLRVSTITGERVSYLFDASAGSLELLDKRPGIYLLNIGTDKGSSVFRLIVY